MTAFSELLAGSMPRVIAGVLVLARVTGLMLQAPILGARAIPQRVRLAVAVGVALPMLALVPQQSSTALAASGNSLWLVFGVLMELGIGLLMGLVAAFLVSAARLAGELAGIQIGFGMATLNDPQTQSQTTPLAEWHNLTAMLLFLAMDGHHLLIRALARSFQQVPLAAAFPTAETYGLIVALTGGLFASALRIASPVLVLMFLVNSAMGVLSKLISQLNVFALGVSINILAGLFILGASEGFVLRHLGTRIAALSEQLASLVQTF